MLGFYHTERKGKIEGEKSTESVRKLTKTCYEKSDSHISPNFTSVEVKAILHFGWSLGCKYSRYRECVVVARI